MSQLPILQNGVFLRETTYNTTSHVAQSSAFSLLNGEKSPATDLGVISLFANRGFLPTNVDTINFRTDRMVLDSKEFTWGVPTGSRTFNVVDVITEGADLGRAGETFQVLMSHKQYDVNWVLSSNPALPYALAVVENPIPYGEHYIYTFKCIHANNIDYGYPRELLTKGSPLFGIRTLDSEYNRNYSSLPTIQGGSRKYMSYVGNTKQQLHYTVTREGAMLHVGDKTKKMMDDHLKVIESYVFRPGSLGYDFQNLSPEERMSNFGTTDVMSAYMSMSRTNSVAKTRFANDTVLSAWVPRIEAIAMATLKNMVNASAFYNAGGQLNIDGVTNTGASTLGLYHQMMLGNTQDFNIQHFTIEMMEAAITTRLAGRVQADPLGNPPTISIKTGRGGISMVQAALDNQVSRKGQIWNAEPYVQNLQGSVNTLFYNTPAFTHYKMRNNMAILRFEYDPALDPMDANPLVNPTVTMTNGVSGNRLSSYMFFIESLDANLEGANVKEVVYGPESEIWGMYHNGRLAYPGSNSSGMMHQGDPNNPGYSVHFFLADIAYWLVDPTKSLVFRPINPITGKPIFVHHFNGK
jgi:hypothetical protein